MIAHLSLLSIFLIGSCSLFGMEIEKADHTYHISSLLDWKKYAQEHESLEGCIVSPQAVAEFHQRYAIKTRLPALPEAIDAWSRITESQDYAQETLTMHTFLRNTRGIQKNTKPSDLINFFIKQSYEQLNSKNKEQIALEKKLYKVPLWGGVVACICGLGLGMACLM